MATSSITKQFVVRDAVAFEKLMTEIEKRLEQKDAAMGRDSLEEGREALKRFLSPNKELDAQGNFHPDGSHGVSKHGTRKPQR